MVVSALGTKTGGLASAEWVSGRHEGKPSRLNGRLTLPDWLSVASSAGTREGKDGHVLVVGHAVGGKLRGPRTKAVAGNASSTGLQLPLACTKQPRSLQCACSRTASAYSAPKGTFCATA